MNPESKIYVAGHTGLLGSAVVRTLEKNKHKNLLLAGRSEVDLLEQKQTFDFLMEERPEYVFLCAARVGGIQANIDSPGEFLFQNLQIQNNVIEGARKAGVKKLLFVGSSCIYPKNPRIPITEDQLLEGPLEPTNEGYALAKVAGIRLCQFYRKQYNCDFIAAIPTNLYGINDHYDLRKSHLLPALIMKVHLAMKNNEDTVSLWGTGKPRREFMLSDDCANALYFLMQNYSDINPINVGLNEDKSILELAEAVRDVLKARVDFEFDTSRPDGMLRKLISSDKLYSMGWKPQYTLKEGIKVSYDDYLARYGE